MCLVEKENWHFLRGRGVLFWSLRWRVTSSFAAFGFDGAFGGVLGFLGELLGFGGLFFTWFVVPVI